VAEPRDDWRTTAAELIGTAPDTLRALASDELHIGGHTNVQLAHPVLDLRAVDDDALATRALDFFVVASLLRGAELARVHVRRGVQATTLARRARRELRAAVTRVDDENLALLCYFDVYLQRADAVAASDGARLVALVERAVGAGPRRAS
jgi:hypothetical protein